MNQEIVAQEKVGLPAAQASFQGPEIIKSDVLLPRVLLMQGLSKLVAARKAASGDIVRASTGEKIGSPEQGFEFIPLTFKNQWTVEELVKGKYAFRKRIARRSLTSAADLADEAGRQEPDRQEASLPWEFKHQGTTWRRVKTMSLIAVLPADIAAFEKEQAKARKDGEMPDLDKMLTPVEISFRSTSFNAGQQVVTHFTMAQEMAHLGAKAHGYSMILKCLPRENDKGSFYVFDVSGRRKLNKTEMAVAERWVQMLSTRNVQVMETDLDTEDSEGGVC